MRIKFARRMRAISPFNNTRRHLTGGKGNEMGNMAHTLLRQGEMADVRGVNGNGGHELLAMFVRTSPADDSLAIDHSLPQHLLEYRTNQVLHKSVHIVGCF